MKKYLWLTVVILIVALAFAGCNSNQPQNASESYKNTESVYSTENNKALIVYYSYSGTTKRVAEHLQAVTGGDLYEVKLSEPYTGSDNDVSDRVFAERRKGEMPELTGELPNVEAYDVIFIGTPVWNNSLANPVSGYLEQTDFNNKTVAPFWTYITNQGSTRRDFSKRIINGNVVDGLPLASAYSISDDELDGLLREWVSNFE